MEFWYPSMTLWFPLANFVGTRWFGEKWKESDAVYYHEHPFACPCQVCPCQVYDGCGPYKQLPHKPVVMTTEYYARHRRFPPRCACEKCPGCGRCGFSRSCGSIFHGKDEIRKAINKVKDYEKMRLEYAKDMKDYQKRAQKCIEELTLDIPIKLSASFDCSVAVIKKRSKAIAKAEDKLKEMDDLARESPHFTVETFDLLRSYEKKIEAMKKLDMEIMAWYERSACKNTIGALSKGSEENSA